MASEETKRPLRMKLEKRMGKGTLMNEAPVERNKVLMQLF
jgi:hypothetical protein